MHFESTNSPTHALVRTSFTKGVFDYVTLVYVTYGSENALIEDINLKICLN